MSRRPLVVDGRVLADAEDADGVGDIGGKARGLLAIEAAGLQTAPWLVVRASAMQPDGRITPALDRALARGIRRLAANGGETFAVRSSGIDEDADGRSFAGQYETVLDVPADQVPAAVERCWRSADAAGVRAYREAAGLPAASNGMAVIVQRMVPAASSGIAFSRPPDGGPDAVIVAVPGLGADLAAGRRDGVEVRVGEDDVVVTSDGGAGPGGQRGTGLDPADARRVAAAARRLEARLGTPQDVEWCLTAGGDLVIVQTRPITTLANRAPDGPLRLWDNANIVESFPGLTLPLTFSIAQEAYATVYRGACRALGVAEAAIEAETQAFDGLLGHIRGRVYYDVGSWHRILALLPAFRSNQALLERMMGAARPGAASGERAAAVGGREVPVRSAVTIAWRLFVVVATFQRRARLFTASQRGILQRARRRDLDTMPPAELVDHLDGVMRRVLGRWQLPIFNDLAVMLFHGSLRRLAERWCDASANATINRLLRSGTHPGAGAAASLRRIAATMRAETASSTTTDRSVEAGATSPPLSEPELQRLRGLLAPYLAGWGGRPPGALHLDRPSLSEDPRLLLVALRDLASVQADEARIRGAGDGTPAAALGVRGAFPIRAMRTMILRVLLNRARYHLTWRERMRLLRMDVFAVGRDIVSALDRAWVGRGLLELSGDVHYLEIGEIRDAVRDPARTDRLRALAATRRRAYDRLRSEPPPPNRFESDGRTVPPAAPVVAGSTARAAGLAGIGVSPGRAHGPAVVVREPREAPQVAGRIVVAPSTDPGWLPLMLAARGLVVEQGSLLSHSAIVARELGLPAVVGVAGATTVLAGGQVVAIDGSTGVVELLDATAAAGRG